MENNGEEIKHFLDKIGIEKEQQLAGIIEDLNRNVTQLVQLLFGDNNNEEEFKKHRKILFRALNNDLFDDLKPLHQNTLRDPEIANIEHLEEAKKQSKSEEEIRNKISYITNHFLTYPKDEDMQSTITLKRKNGFIQVVGETTGSINLPEISQPTFAVDPNSSKKNKSKFEDVIANLNQLVK